MSDRRRPDVVAARHQGGFLTAHERLESLLDPGSMLEYGVLNGHSPDGWIPTTGGVDCVGTVDGRAVVASSTDYSDHGGGYGAGRLPRLFNLAHQHRWPLVLFSDGGGSRASYGGWRATDVGLGPPVSRFSLFDGMAELSGWAPTVAVVSGPSYAGHASLTAFCDFVIATRGSSIGMGGPPMVEAALGVRVTHQELAPVEMHDEAGAIDLLVDSEPEAVAAVRRYLAYLSDEPAGPADGSAGAIGSIVVGARATGTAYDARSVITALVDQGSLFELRRGGSGSVVTALARLGGRTVGVLASQPMSPLGGAIDQGAADKIARFVEICDVYGYPIVALVDTPGFALVPPSAEGPVGQPNVASDPAGSSGRFDLPAVEATPGPAVMTRRHARPFLVHHHRTVPLYSVAVGRAGGLAPFALTGTGPGQIAPPLRLAWPTAELGPPGLPSALRDRNSNDDVIDPADTRGYLIQMLALSPRPERPPTKKHPVDTA